MRRHIERRRFLLPAITLTALVYVLLGGLLTVLARTEDSRSVVVCVDCPSWPSFALGLTLLAADLAAGLFLFARLKERRPVLAGVVLVISAAVALGLLSGAYTDLFGGWHGGLLTRSGR